MNLIEGFSQDNWELSLWSDAMHRVDTSTIKNLIGLVAGHLDLQLSVKAKYFNKRRYWVISFFWIGGGERIICDHTIDQIVLSRNYIDGIASEISDRINSIIRSEENQSWVIVRYREGFLAGIHQAGRTSVSLILREVTQDRNFATNHIKVTIDAWIPGNAIPRSDGVEVDGMLLQGELLEWLEIGEERRFRFSPNTHQVNVSGTPDEIRITFSTRPRTGRLASFERISRLIEQGQIEIPRSGYFDQYLMGYPDRPERVRLEIPRECEFTEPSGESFQVLEGRFEVAREAVLLPRINAINAIGDTTCQYNARSRMIRCAVNPCGPCEGCQHYEKI
ncbi:DUF6464 family protein [Nostoc sp.]|uniref:DUF6464 family protein n=1 Tax=Nostoc sp. TaxID=1180 RepID=UPI003FA57599